MDTTKKCLGSFPLFVHPDMIKIPGYWGKNFWTTVTQQSSESTVRYHKDLLFVLALLQYTKQRIVKTPIPRATTTAIPVLSPSVPAVSVSVAVHVW